MINLDSVYIVAAQRSPIGRFGGQLASLSAADLALQVAEAVVPAELRPSVDQVVLGQVLQAGTGMNVARQAGLRLGLPQTAPAFTVNMVCGSGMKAVALGASAIATGEAQLVLAGGTESMSQAPFYSRDLRGGRKLGDSVLVDAIMADGLSDPVLGLGMGETAERIADLYHIRRDAQDAFACLSQQRAASHRTDMRREIVSLATRAGQVETDEHPRADTTEASLAKLKPVFRTEGTVTAGNASGINDGAALLLLANEAALTAHDLQPRARIVACANVGCDPALMGLGPVNAVRQLLAQTGWAMDEVDAIELNEAFAAQVLACVQELNLDEDRLNARGGAIALGHPIGASGARVLVTLLHRLEDDQTRRGIATLCVGGGMGIAMAIERC